MEESGVAVAAVGTARGAAASEVPSRALDDDTGSYDPPSRESAGGEGQHGTSRVRGALATNAGAGAGAGAGASVEASASNQAVRIGAVESGRKTAEVVAVEDTAACDDDGEELHHRRTVIVLNNGGNASSGAHGFASLGLGASLGLFKDGLKLDFASAVDDKPIHVAHHLYIGSLRAAFNRDGLLRAGITHILNLSGVEDTYPDCFAYMSHHMRDCEAQDLLTVFDHCASFVHNGCRGGSRILVHCNAGRSRSPGIIMAYLIVAKGWSFQRALDAITDVRPKQCVNDGFLAQLYALALAKGDVQAARELVRLDEEGWQLCEGSDDFAASLPRRKRDKLYHRAETT